MSGTMTVTPSSSFLEKQRWLFHVMDLFPRKHPYRVAWRKHGQDPLQTQALAVLMALMAVLVAFVGISNFSQLSGDGLGVDLFGLVLCLGLFCIFLFTAGQLLKAATMFGKAIREAEELIGCSLTIQGEGEFKRRYVNRSLEYYVVQALKDRAGNIRYFQRLSPKEQRPDELKQAIAEYRKALAILNRIGLAEDDADILTSCISPNP